MGERYGTLSDAAPVVLLSHLERDVTVCGAMVLASMSVFARGLLLIRVGLALEFCSRCR